MERRIYETSRVNSDSRLAACNFLIFNPRELLKEFVALQLRYNCPHITHISIRVLDYCTGVCLDI